MSADGAFAARAGARAGTDPARPLAGRAALVTGASSGLGEGIAKAFAAAGAKVAVNYHSGRERAEAVVRAVEEAGGEAVAVGADVSDEAEVERMVAETCERLGRLDVLVANSGIQRDAPFAEMSLADWRAVIDTNLTGAFLCMRAALRRFRAQEDRPDLARARGAIVAVSSVHETIPWAGHANYAAAKGGLGMLVRSLAQEVAGERVRVNAVAPGAVATRINEGALGDEAGRRRVLGLIPSGRLGEVEDVAAAALWLASDAGDYVTGQTLYVDGGMTLYPGFRDNG